MVSFVIAALIGAALLAAVYGPTFALVAWLRPPLSLAIPIVMAGTLGVACLLVLVISRRKRASLSAFGFKWPGWRPLLIASLLAAPLSAATAALLLRFPEHGPVQELTLAPWLLALQFGLVAPIQEEVIFRGLIQGGIPLLHAGLGSVAASRIPLIVAATLFAAVHLEVGPVTAMGAAALGLLAGELRSRTSSLLPAIVAHSIFNLPDLFGII